MKSFSFLPVFCLFVTLVTPYWGVCQSENCDTVDISISVNPSYAVLSCNVPSVILEANPYSAPENGSYTVSWLGINGQSVVTIDAIGTYTAIITDNETGCTAVGTSVVDTLINPIVVETADEQEISCLSPCTILDASVTGGSGVISIEWEGPDSFYSNTLTPEVCLPGLYVLSVHEQIGGCFFYDSILVVDVYSSIEDNHSALICPGGCVEFAGQEFCEIGNYQLVFDSWQNCDSIIHLEIDIINIDAVLEFPDTLNCQHEQINLNAENSQMPADADFYWSTIDGNFVMPPNGFTPSIDEPGVYIFTIDIGNDCQSSDTITVIANRDRPEATAGEDTQLDCLENIANIHAEIDSNINTVDVSWTGPNNFSSSMLDNVVSQSGIYQLKVTNTANGCKAEDEVYVAPPEEVSLEWMAEQTCWNEPNGAITVAAINGGNAPYYYSIDDEDYQLDTVFQQLNTGHYTLYWKDQYECGGQTDIFIPEIPPLQPDLQNYYHICNEEYTTLNAAVNLNTIPTPISYLWSNGVTDPVIQTNRAGEYWVEISNICELVHKEIEIINDFVPPEQNVFVPNAFSPNNDKVNDFFLPYISHDVISFEMRIFDRRGSMMFGGTNIDEGWDGKVRDREAPVGVYAWWMEYTIRTCGGGLDYGTLQGDVTLFR